MSILVIFLGQPAAEAGLVLDCAHGSWQAMASVPTHDFAVSDMRTQIDGCCVSDNTAINGWDVAARDWNWNYASVQLFTGTWGVWTSWFTCTTRNFACGFLGAVDGACLGTDVVGIQMACCDKAGTQTDRKSVV